MPQSPSPTFWTLCAAHVAYGAWGGWQLPLSLQGQAFPAGFLGISLSVFPIVAFTIAGLARPMWKSLPYPTFRAPVDKLLGQGTYEYMFLDAGLALLLGTTAAIAGTLSLTRTFVLGAGTSPALASVFILSAGIGMLIAFAAQVKRGRNPAQST
jgi:hypothetical protein